VYGIQRFRQRNSHGDDAEFAGGSQKIPKSLYSDRLRVTNYDGFQCVLCETRWVYIDISTVLSEYFSLMLADRSQGFRVDGVEQPLPPVTALKRGIGGGAGLQSGSRRERFPG
jgi:hypothetical protein